MNGRDGLVRLLAATRHSVKMRARPRRDSESFAGRNVEGDMAQIFLERSISEPWKGLSRKYRSRSLLEVGQGGANIFILLIRSEIISQN